MSEIVAECEFCDRKKYRYEDYRFFFGEWELGIDGLEDPVETLCDDCHRIFIRD